MAIGWFPGMPSLTRKASQIKRREVTKAKSRTFLASYTQVFFAVDFCWIALLASSRVTISTGSFDCCACFHLPN